MDTFAPNKRCTCHPRDVNNYPDVAMSTDSYHPRHKAAQTTVQCFSKGSQETNWPCSSILRSLAEVEDERPNVCSAFHRGGDLRFSFDTQEHCDVASRRWQAKFVNNNRSNNNSSHNSSNNNSNSNSSNASSSNSHNNGDRKRLFRANDEIVANAPWNQLTPRIRNCQYKCPGPISLFQSSSKTEESGDFKDVFDSFEMLNRNHVNDSVSLRSSLSDEQIVSFQIPNSRMRKMKAREVRKERIKTSSCLRLTTTNKYGILVAILCFIVVVFFLVFSITWTAFHRKEQCIPPSQVHSNFGSPWAVAGVSMNNWSTDEDGEGWGVYREGGSRYKAFDVTTNFEAAQEFCERRGGHLPRIETIREQVYIEEYLQKNTKHETRADNHQRILGFWIGGRRPRGSHGGGCMFDQWKWVDLYGRVHGSISGFTAFAQGKPDNIFDPEECLYIVHEEGLDEASNFKWDDTACDVSSLGGIKVFCEVELR